MTDWPPLEKLERIASWAALDHWSGVLSHDEKWFAAFDGCVDAAAAGLTAGGDLKRAAMTAVSYAAEAERHTHGIPRPHANGRGFGVYWNRRSAGDEYEAVEDKLALRQVMSSLREVDRATLRQLVAADGDLAAAAGLAGVSRHAYEERLRRARNFARLLWFEPERPPRHFAKNHGRHASSVAAMYSRVRGHRHQRKLRQLAGQICE